MKPSNRLTVVMRDDGPFIHVGANPSYRSVSITLTDEQMKAIRLRHDEECVSQCWIEPSAESAGGAES
jgi:hypothetical protein